MNDRWTKDEIRWNKLEQAWVARRFRYHVRVPSNPLGRIHREPCSFCAEERWRVELGGGTPAMIDTMPFGEAHHPDYDQTFLVVWVCLSHHRRVDHGTLEVPERHLRDYSSLITNHRPQLHRKGPAEAQAPAGEKVPF